MILNSCKTMNIHTIVFMLDDCSLPIEKKLLSESARLINILTDPNGYGWKGEVNEKTGICYMDMKDLGITKRTILEFIRTIRQGFPSMSITELDMDNMEHFAILIGAGGVDCPFREAINNTSLNNNMEDIEPNINAYNPMIPPEDIYHIFQWRVMRDHDSANAREWSVTVQAGISVGNNVNFYYRKRTIEQID